MYSNKFTLLSCQFRGMNGFILLRAGFGNPDFTVVRRRKRGSICIESVSSRLVSGWEDVGWPGKVAAQLAIFRRYPAKENTAAGPQRFLHPQGQDAGLQQGSS